MDAFRGAAMSDYENRLLKYLRECFPEQVKTDGDAKTRMTIREGIQRASEHALITELDTALYIEVMYLLGPEFETDPRYPWAGEILRGPADKAKRLHSRASEVIRSAP
jgi:hypothetical protein